MYHYVVIKAVIFFFLTFTIITLFQNSEAAYSPKQRWNYKKKEDTINHHTLNLKIKAKNQRITSNDSMEKIKGDKDGSYKRRPGSPRERW
tara:strand:- start:2636 stop:2905 length:270 start_codon:yes stop_codon:yes gene_type:complete